MQGFESGVEHGGREVERLSRRVQVKPQSLAPDRFTAWEQGYRTSVCSAPGLRWAVTWAFARLLLTRLSRAHREPLHRIFFCEPLRVGKGGLHISDQPVHARSVFNDWAGGRPQHRLPCLRHHFGRFH